MTETPTPDTTKKSPIRKITLAALGPNLPLGLMDAGGTFQRAIEVKRWRLKEEKALGALRDQHRDANLAQYVGMVLATMCTRIGHVDLSGFKKLIEATGTISTMYLGDVFYAYCWLRSQALGNVFKSKVRCPRCANRYTLEADLGSLEVTVPDSLQACLHEYTLKDPLQLRGQTFAALQLGPCRWHAIENQKVVGSLNTGAAKAEIIRGSIVGVVGHPNVVLTEDELEELSKMDLEGITAAVEKRAIGPDMSLEDTCPKCNNPFRHPIDWGYDSFFGGSSQ